jgi:hypothetical protein
MTFFPGSLLERLGRSRKLKAYRLAWAEAEVLSYAELNYMGLERCQLGHLARASPFRS